MKVARHGAQRNAGSRIQTNVSPASAGRLKCRTIIIFENLEAGASLDEIMEWFQGLDRDQVKAVIEFAAPRS